VRTFVWTLAGVDSAMTSQAGGLWQAEFVSHSVSRLSAVWSFAHITEPLATSNMLALVWLLPGVCSHMHRQGTPLDEALAASWRAASVWALVCVYPVMPLQI
jgi:hypothetical protein